MTAPEATTPPPGAEARRLAEANGEPGVPWRRWGPYLSERAWGTVREDYSPDGEAWTWFGHDDARSRTYRWNEDGMAGICDDHQFLCLSLSLWNGTDPILKERMFGLTGPEGNHAEDAKDYWFFLDSTPTHSWMRWRYLYPQAPFPYDQLRAESRRRSKADPEFELLDTGAFDGGYWEVTVDVAKAGPEDLCLAIGAVNVSDHPAELHVVPTLWLRNTWGWGRDTRKATLSAADGTVHVDGHSWLGPRVLAGDGDPELLFCDNETNRVRVWGAPEPASARFPKDGINDHIVHGTATVNPDGTGTKAALWYRRTVGPGEATHVRLRLAPRPTNGPNATANGGPPRPTNGPNTNGHNANGNPPDLGTGWEQVMAARSAEADAWNAGLCAQVPGGLAPPEAGVLRQAAAGMLWSKQYYHYDVAHWLQGDPAFPPPPPQRAAIRNGAWRHLSNSDIISMPDTWEYPWYASWDLAFQCIALAHLDPAFAKDQLVMVCREWFMHPNGQLPAYEWDFGDANPPVLAYAALRVWHIDGRWDYEFLERILHKLAINFTWWVNREDPSGTNVFAGGFLGLDNIAPFDRSKMPPGFRLDQADGTGWMAFYALSLLGLALELAAHDDTYEDLATKFFEHFTYIAVALDTQGLWDEQDGFFYDLLHNPDGSTERIRVRSMVGLIPLFAVGVLEADMLERLPVFRSRMEWFEYHRPEYGKACRHAAEPGHRDRRLLSIASPDRLRRILGWVLDESEFLSPHGIRALSKFHAGHPAMVSVGDMRAEVGYEPAESRTALFGGNSNWRGPVWFPVNHMLCRTLLAYDEFCGPEFKIEHPTGSGRMLTLRQVARELAGRLTGLFLEGPDGRRPVHGGITRFDRDPRWHGLIPFHEYFHGDTGSGLGASHQTGWTGLIIDLLLGMPGEGIG